MFTRLFSCEHFARDCLSFVVQVLDLVFDYIEHSVFFGCGFVDTAFDEDKEFE